VKGETGVGSRKDSAQRHVLLKGHKHITSLDVIDDIVF